MITLGIIGVVAAMTIPGLIKSYQNKVALSRLKATYALINNAIRMAKVDYGETDGWDIFSTTGGKVNGSGYKDLNREYVAKYIIPYLKVANDYGVVPLKQAGMSDWYEANGTTYVTKTYNLWYIVDLYNGATLIFGFNGFGNCQIDDSGTIGWCLKYPMLFVDTNGNKKPNALCKDIFLLKLDNNSGMYVFLTPDGETRDRYLKSGCESGNSGYCGKLIQANGWKMPKDYPWSW